MRDKEIAALLERVRSRLYNAFEPGGQSQLYQDVANAIDELAPPTKLTEMDFAAIEERVLGRLVSQIRQDQLPPSSGPGEKYTYASNQAANCAVCGKHKHTPLRVDWMGGYVCLSCINRALTQNVDPLLEKFEKDFTDMGEVLTAEVFGDWLLANQGCLVKPQGHPDNHAVDSFAATLKAKLDLSRAHGRYGWNDPEACSDGRLAELLVAAVRDGDPVDIGNYAMMVHQRSVPAELVRRTFERAMENAREQARKEALKDHGEESVGVLGPARRLGWLPVTGKGVAEFLERLLPRHGAYAYEGERGPGERTYLSYGVALGAGDLREQQFVPYVDPESGQLYVRTTKGFDDRMKKV